jgi:phospholipase/carboxylesterase
MRDPTGSRPAAGPPDPGRDPHAGLVPVRLGAETGEANAAVLLVHGRGGSPEGMAEFARVLARPGTTWLAPRAAGGTWYPFSFLSPLERNQPWLDSALRALARAVDGLRDEGLGSERIVLLGFSQGGCLATEFAARNARRWGGLAALSGGLIGPPGTPRDYAGSLEGTPAFLGCGDPDPHVPRDRVEESGRVLAALGAEADVRIYPGLGHAVNTDEIEAVRSILAGLD